MARRLPYYGNEVAESFNLVSLCLKAVSEDRQVKLSGFGSFESFESKARTGRNPSTGEAISIPAKKRIRFKPSETFKKTTNGTV